MATTKKEPDKKPAPAKPKPDNKQAWEKGIAIKHTKTK